MNNKPLTVRHEPEARNHPPETGCNLNWPAVVLSPEYGKKFPEAVTWFKCL